MDNNTEQYFNEKIDSHYRILDGKIDELRDRFDTKLDNLHDSVTHLTTIVSNGLSHKTDENYLDIKHLKETVATKQELKEAIQDRADADSAWKQARRWRITTMISIASLIITIVVAIVRSSGNA